MKSIVTDPSERPRGGVSLAHTPLLAPPPVDQVAIEERVASLAKRSLKKEAKVAGLKLAIRMMDLTTLEGKDTAGKVRALCNKAMRPLESDPSLGPCAAICVYPNMVPIAKAALEGSGVHVASVATAFPSGLSPLPIKLDDVRRAVDFGADEIDMVIDRGAMLSGDYAKVFDEIAQTKDACGKAHLKVILETAELGTYPVQIHSAEHFCAGIKHWTCAATVVRHPTDGDILGALDVSGLSSTFSRQSLALAVTTGKRIESRLAIAEMERRYRLLDASIGWWREVGDDGAVLFDRRGTPIKANGAAAQAIADAGGNGQWLRNMTRLPALAQRQQGSAADVRRLPPWMRVEWLQPVVVQGQCVGTMMVVPQARRVLCASRPANGDVQANT